MGRPPCCDKSNVKRGPWTAEEDAKMLAYVSTHGTGNWTSVPKKAGLNRCGKSCRLRWTNYLRPDLRHESFTPQEEELIVTLHATIGSRWSLIAAQLPGRTDNDVKNHWNTKLRKKLCEMGIDPVTHKPMSQILADYGSMGLARTRPIISTSSTSSKSYPYLSQTPSTTRISCLNRDLRNAFMRKPEPASPNPFSTVSMATAMTTEMMPAANPDGALVNNQPAWELLAQLQAIKLVADASNQESLEPHSFFQGPTSSLISSFSSLSITSTTHPHDNIQTPTPLHFPRQPSQVQETISPSSFNWSEFLSEDAFQQLSWTEDSSDQPLDDMLYPTPELLDGENDQQCNVGFADAGGGVSVAVDHGCNMMGGGTPTEISEAASGNSFVEAILDRERKMLGNFPEIQIIDDR